MLKIIAIVLMLGTGPNGEKDTYIFTDPVHSSVEDCISWVRTNVPNIYGLMYKVYGDRKVENVYCMQTDKMEEFFGYTFEEFKEKSGDDLGLEPIPPKKPSLSI
tara:strand:+ start:1162 stop:1473 length:312 start_codon:yes stop_codon:yes gene_type:complete